MQYHLLSTRVPGDAGTSRWFKHTWGSSRYNGSSSRSRSSSTPPRPGSIVYLDFLDPGDKPRAPFPDWAVGRGVFSGRAAGSQSRFPATGHRPTANRPPSTQPATRHPPPHMPLSTSPLANMAEGEPVCAPHRPTSSFYHLSPITCRQNRPAAEHRGPRTHRGTNQGRSGQTQTQPGTFF
jgi:hypothetical protein